MNFSVASSDTVAYIEARLLGLIERPENLIQRESEEAEERLQERMDQLTEHLSTLQQTASRQMRTHIQEEAARDIIASTEAHTAALTRNIETIKARGLSLENDLTKDEAILVEQEAKKKLLLIQLSQVQIALDGRTIRSERDCKEIAKIGNHFSERIADKTRS